jgi:hypothetical protein
MKNLRGVQLLLIVFIFAAPVVVKAQVPDFTDNVQDVPFDGGVSLLVAAGIGYGIKKARQHKRAEKK